MKSTTQTDDGHAAHQNGSRPPAIPWEKVLDVLTVSPDHTLFTKALIYAVEESGSGCLFRAPVQQRCAQVLIHAPEIYRGSILDLLTAILPQRWRTWDEDIQRLSRSQQTTFATPQRATEVLSTSYPPLRYFVDELLAEGLTILAGKPKKGKSYLALDMSLAIAVGRQAFMKFATEKSKVLYVSLEDGPRRLQRRLRAIQPNLVNPDGLDFLYTFPRLGEGALEALTHYAATYQVIIVDVLGRILPAQSPTRKSLSEYQELTDTLGPIQHLAQDQRMAIVMIDHLRKASVEDDGDAIMGSQGKIGAADHALIYGRKGEEKDGVIKIISRDLEEERIVLSMVNGHLEFVGKGEIYELDSEHNKILKILEEEDHPLSIPDIMKAMGIVGDGHYKRFRVVMHRLYNEDRVGKTKKGLYTLYGHDRVDRWEY